MMGLSDGRKSFLIGLAVLIQYRSVTASQPATQPASHVAVAITLNAKASSLITCINYNALVICRTVLHDLSVLAIRRQCKSIADQRNLSDNLHV